MTKNIQRKRRCVICGKGRLTKCLDLNKSALANSYVKKEDLGKREDTYPLRMYYCHNCHLVQLMDWVDRKLLFEQYAYVSSTSPQLDAHFKKYAREIKDRFPKQTKKLVVEIGSNDGILLKHFQKSGAPVLGVDPAKNIVRLAKKNGIDTLPVFFDLRVAKDILKKRGPAGIITANNVIAHTDDHIHGLMAGVTELLDPKGVFVFEVQYIADLLKNHEFDNTYHEHIYYFSLHPLVTLLEKWGLGVFDVQRVSTQGSSIRVYAARLPLPFPIQDSVKKMLAQEKKSGLHLLKTYQNFGAEPKAIKKDLLKLLADLKQKNKKIVGYGAPAKGNTLLQYCGIGTETIDYIVDNSPHKQGKYTPGTHIPIRSPEHLKKDLPDYILLLAWNYADSIMSKEQWLRTKGVKFIKPIPRVRVIEQY